MEENNNNNNNKNKNMKITHSLELLIWLLVVLIFVSFISLNSIYKEKNDENDYQIFLQDVDGLIVGSPVRMMGIEVGHVTKIKPTNNEVYVKFILTTPDVYIPQGARVTVEFSGMAGSKSLEIYPPDKIIDNSNSTPVLSVMPPKRLHDALGLLNDMFKKLASISYTASTFGNKLDSTGLKPNKTEVITTTENFKDFLQYTNSFLDTSTDKAKDLKKSLNNLKRLKNNE